MSEIIEQSQSNTYIQVSIDDNINNQYNKINYDDSLINLIPDNNVFITIANSVSAFANLPKQSLQLAIFGIGNIVITKDYNDPLKLSIDLFNMTTDAFIQSISLEFVGCKKERLHLN